MSPLEQIAPAFVDIAHRIVWCVAATSTPDGTPRSRVLHPIWDWDGSRLTGWIATSPLSPKAADLAARPQLSLTYWDATQDTCTADCDVTWEDEAGRRAVWERFANVPPPLGYDPTIIPGWTSPDVPAFGAIRLTPRRLRVLPGSALLSGTGEVLTWRG